MKTFEVMLVHPSGHSCTFKQAFDKAPIHNVVFLGRSSGEVTYRIIHHPLLPWWSICSGGKHFLDLPYAALTIPDWINRLSGKVLQLEFLAITEGIDSPSFFRPHKSNRIL